MTGREMVEQAVDHPMPNDPPDVLAPVGQAEISRLLVDIERLAAGVGDLDAGHRAYRKIVRLLRERDELARVLLKWADWAPYQAETARAAIARLHSEGA